MKIRKAEKKDIPRILALLGKVLQIHAEIRPDIFIPGTTKYTPCELTEHFYEKMGMKTKERQMEYIL